MTLSDFLWGYAKFIWYNLASNDCALNGIKLIKIDIKI